RLVDQLPGYRRPEDGEPPVRSQPALPVQLPIHAGSEEIELREAARAGVANGLGHHLLARRVLVERLVVTDLDEEVPAAVNDGEVSGDRLSIREHRPDGQRSPAPGMWGGPRSACDQLLAVRGR